MKIYENNFQRLMLLLPEFQGNDNQGILLQSSGSLHVDLLERHKYTTVIKLSQHLPLSLPAAAIASMMVRVYHDAEVAEVLSYQQHHRFKPRYDYPNPAMCQVYEKRRVNIFLGEWLDYCLAGSVPVKTAALC